MRFVSVESVVTVQHFILDSTHTIHKFHLIDKDFLNIYSFQKPLMSSALKFSRYLNLWALTSNFLQGKIRPAMYNFMSMRSLLDVLLMQFWSLALLVTTNLYWSLALLVTTDLYHKSCHFFIPVIYFNRGWPDTNSEFNLNQWTLSSSRT